MRRPYTADQYAALAGKLRSAIPGLALTTDVIVGFPGETDQEFAESLAFVERMAFARPHIFTYSQREGTHADTLPDQVPHAVKKERVQAMLEVAGASDRAFRQGQLGQTLDVVWEDTRDGQWRGLSDNYIRVQADAPARRLVPGMLAPAQLTELHGAGVMASL